MTSQFLRAIIVVASLCAVAGCGSTALRHGAKALDEGQFEEAATFFQEILDKDPGNLAALRGLGQTRYQQKDYAGAEDLLRRAQSLSASDGLVALYLGLSREQREDMLGAEGAYEAYLATNPSAKHARPIRGRLMYLRNQALRQQARDAVRLEQSLTRDTTGIPTVAVLPFTLTGAAADSLQPLARGLAAAVTHDLFQVKSIKVVERLRLQDIIDELELAESGFVAQESAPRVGRLVGADHLVSSGLEFMDGLNVSIQSGIVDPGLDAYKLALLSEEQYTRVWKIQKDITFAILDSLGITLTAQERNAIKKFPTEKFPAFLAYSRGIDFFDRGDYDQASTYFTQATKIDPGFKQAGAMQDQADMLMSGSKPIADFETSMAAGLAAAVTFDIGPAADFFYIAEPVADPRTDDEPSVETGTTSVGGRIP